MMNVYERKASMFPILDYHKSLIARDHFTFMSLCNSNTWTANTLC